MDKPKRKGAAKISDVTPEIRKQLEAAEIESATLSEGLAIDFPSLIANIFPKLAAQARAGIDPKLGITKRMALASEIILIAHGRDIIKTLMQHPSDTVRGWAAYAIAGQPDLSLEDKLKHIKPLADDHHFGVREWAWLAIRPDVAKAPDQSIEILTPWVSNPSQYIRRFACEALRPRGVWSPHIAILKSNPELALPILDPLKSDEARYVQDSVANWLNDAFKSQPEWVIALCEDWQNQSPSKETAYIVKRGLRSK
jgi:3-methyladenine DNA glycosylase AlkC